MSTPNNPWGPPGSEPQPPSRPAQPPTNPRQQQPRQQQPRQQQPGQHYGGQQLGNWPEQQQPVATWQQQGTGVDTQHVQFASGWTRLGARLLDSLLAVVTLGIGWLIWAAVIAGEGYTPGKKLLGLRVIRTDTGRPASFAWMLFMRGFVAGFVAQFAIFFTLGILLFMPFWDRRNQNIWDKVSSSVVVHDPDGRFASGIAPQALA